MEDPHRPGVIADIAIRKTDTGLTTYSTSVRTPGTGTPMAHPTTNEMVFVIAKRSGVASSGLKRQMLGCGTTDARATNASEVSVQY
ncbi:hypothetical protein RvY_12909 [Ramazzottius varieornatus]|uniref:Uncharacterized protein n=1 Tax=Ramazzottius varieornatus TaxID=947166 RepID=A0A1D1VNC1_RAMVA|nr:hypothetical protein RvY_12909 [Ramazzottius varieornatus]